MLRWCVVFCALFLVSSHEGLKIGSPFHYWRTDSFVPFLAFVAVLVLLLRSLNHIAKQRHVSLGSVAGSISLAIVAFVILWLLPVPEVGIRLLPTFPWSYSGFVASTMATVVWLLIFIGIGFTHDADGDGPLPGLFCAFMFFAFSLNAAISFSETTTSVRADASTVADEQVNLADFREEICDWRSRAMSLRQQLAQLTHDRQAVSQFISTMKESDLTPPLELALELEELDQQIDRIELEIASIENAILKSESNLRRIERKQATERTFEQTDAEYESLAAVQHELQDLAE